jgi:diaminopimelate decarboxylase
VLGLLAARARECSRRVPARTDRLRCAGLLCRQGQLQPRRADVLARRGAGFDIVSAGELKRVLNAGADPRRIVFSGVGKTAAEMELALNTGILCFNVESAAELERLERVAGALARPRRSACASIRTSTPDAPLYLDRPQGKQVRRRLRRRAGALPAGRRLANLEVSGIDCHIGSQLLDAAPFAEALDKLLLLVDQLAATVSCCITSTSAAASASATVTKMRRRQAYLQPMLEKLKGRQLRSCSNPVAAWLAMRACC